MQIINGDIWDFHKQGYWIVIPTNIVCKQNGEAVMGAGLALEAKQRFPLLPTLLGEKIREKDTLDVVFFFNNEKIVTLPTKYHWREKSNLPLMEQGIIDLAYSKVHASPIYLPQLGCGNGNLDWETQVEPIMEKHLSDDFIVVIR